MPVSVPTGGVLRYHPIGGCGLPGGGFKAILPSVIVANIDFSETGAGPWAERKRSQL